MATASYTFQSYAENANPIGDGWTRTIVAGSGATRGSAIVLGSTPITGVDRYWNLSHSVVIERNLLRPTNGLTRSGTSEVLVLLRKDATSRGDFQIGPGMGTGSPHVYVSTSPTSCGGNTYLLRGRDDISSSWSGSLYATINPCDDVWHYLRFQIEGTVAPYTVRGRMWAETSTEPSTWSIRDRSDTYPTDTPLGLFYVNTVTTALDADIAYISIGTAGDAAPMPSEEPEPTAGITITGIKEPNIANEEVTGVSNARVKVWHGASPVDTGAEDELIPNQTITNGSLTTELTGGTLADNAIVEVMWTVGTERKLFIAETTVVDTGSGA